MSSFMASDKSKTIYLLDKRDKGCLTIYISSLWFYRAGGHKICDKPRMYWPLVIN